MDPVRPGYNTVLLLYCALETGTRCLEKIFADYSTELSMTLILSIIYRNIYILEVAAHYARLLLVPAGGMPASRAGGLRPTSKMTPLNLLTYQYDSLNLLTFQNDPLQSPHLPI